MFRTVAAIAILAATTTICGADDAVPETTATINAVVPEDGAVPSAGPHKRFVNTASMETGNTVPLWMSSGPPRRFANRTSEDLYGASAGPQRRYVNSD